MADPSGEASSSSSVSEPTIREEIEKTNEDFIEPDQKRRKLLVKHDGKSDQKLEHRLGGILCCAVCLDLPRSAVYQVIFFTLTYPSSLLITNYHLFLIIASMLDIIFFFAIFI